MSVTIPTIYIQRSKDIVTLYPKELGDVKTKRFRNCNTHFEEQQLKYIRRELRL